MGIFRKVAEICRKIVVGYVFYTFLLTLIAYIIIPTSQSQSPEEAMNIILNNIVYSMALAQILIWTLTSCLLSVSMFFSRNTREIVLKRLSGIKERDEREIQIVGKALRASYLSTMTFLLFLLAISFFRVEVSVKHFDNIRPGQHPNMMYVNGELGFDIIDSEAIITQKEGYDSFFDYNDIPVSKKGLILLLIIWQIISFRLVSRRALKVPG